MNSIPKDRLSLLVALFGIEMSARPRRNYQLAPMTSQNALGHTVAMSPGGQREVPSGSGAATTGYSMRAMAPAP